MECGSCRLLLLALVNAGEEAAAVEDQCSVLPRLVFFVLF
jgi:hypothetical protein